MNPKPGDVFKLLEPDGRIAAPGHPFVILWVSGEMALFGNLTDAENEGDVPCLLHPEDAPAILTKTSTFRYQSIREGRTDNLTRAFADRKLLHCGHLPSEALQKILTGAVSARLIKPKYCALLKP